ncbi:hypothetical protein FJZ53_06995 [Candidatus Woesearchaeota archaeon]|nr:hypothetical protein [Candidatus Woesearchaeota archaeon]
MSRLMEMVDKAIIAVKTKVNESVLDEYKTLIKQAEEHADGGVLGYYAWLLKDREKIESYFPLNETFLMKDFKKKIRDDSLVGMTDEDMQKAWDNLANYTNFLRPAKRMAQIYEFLKWDDNWEKEVTSRGKKGLMKKLEKDMEDYETFARSVAGKGHYYEIDYLMTDLIIKKDVIKYHVEESAQFTQKMQDSIHRLREMHNLAKKVADKEHYNDLMRMSERAAEDGEYSIPSYFPNIKVNTEDMSVKITDLKNLQKYLMSYKDYLKRAGKIAKQNPELKQDYKEKKRKIETKGRLNVTCRMAVDIEKLQENCFNGRLHDSMDSFENLVVLKEIMKLLEEGKI